MHGRYENLTKRMAPALAGLTLLVTFALPLHSAKAVVPVLDSANLTVNTKTAAGVGALVTKEYTLDPLSWIAKLVIRQLRDMVIRWIVTGQFGFPSFQGSFTIDPARIAENAARIFLWQLTGINFCSFALDIPSPLNFRIAEDFGLSCSLPPGLNQDYRRKLVQWIDDPYSLPLEERWAFTDPQANRAYLYVEAVDRKAEAEAKALIARAAEVSSGGGFIGKRDPVTGKINTPGRVIANYLQEAIGSNFREGDVADELNEAIVAILDTLVGKIINDGLGTIFGG